MEKKDLKSLSRAELIDLIYDMKKSDMGVDMPSFSEINEERKRLRNKKEFKKALFKTAEVFLVVIAASILITNLYLPILKIYGGSMEPTLNPNDVVLSVKENKFKTGDLIAFYQGNKLLVKRVIATQGQWIDIDDDGIVRVDGVVLDEPYIDNFDLGNCDITFPHQVKEASLFVMGDNRDTSLDSRLQIVSDVSIENVESKLIFRIWPLNKFGSI